MRQLWLILAGAIGLAGLAGAADAPPPASTRPAEPANVVVLQAGRADRSGTIWRILEASATNVARSEAGKLVPVDPFHPRVPATKPANRDQAERAGQAAELSLPLQEAKNVIVLTPPPAGWTKPEFDDSDWPRTPSPTGANYRAIGLTCLRGRFLVNDPAQVVSLSLDLSIQGGAVAYLNGQEIGRVGLPQGKVQADTLAEDYPREAFFSAAGALLRGGPDPESQARLKQRQRTATLAIPASALRPGVNVLAVEVHRAAAPEAMFTYVAPKTMGTLLLEQRNWWWNRCSLDDLKLAAKARPGALTPNVARPVAAQVWTHPSCERLDGRWYGEPGMPPAPIKLAGARNGSYSAQIVVSLPQAIGGLKVVPAAGQSGFPPITLRVGYPAMYPNVGYDQIEDAAPAEVPCPRGGVAFQPIWVTADVPASAKPGDYATTLAVSAEGLAPVIVPLQIHVADWTLPDRRDFKMHNAFIQSPDSVAIAYNVPMWSRRHWDLIERSFQVLATMATKELNIPVTRRTHFGNEHGMIRWVRQADGALAPDLSIVERYVELGVKHLGKVPLVVFYVIEADADQRPWVSIFDPKTGQWENAVAPAWGTEAARAFWKPAMDGAKAVLKKHGLENSLALGYHANTGNGPCTPAGCIKDMQELVPEARWVRVGHFWFQGHEFLDKGPNGNPWGRVSMVSGQYTVAWDPDVDKPFYGWRNPVPILGYSRGIWGGGSALSEYRMTPETVLICGWREETGRYTADLAGSFGRDQFPGVRGLGPWGADFWAPIIARYNDPAAGAWDPRSCWSTVQLSALIPYVIGRGADGPAPSLRTAMFQEGLQESEARIYCQDAILDDAARAKLGDELAGARKKLCDDRTRLLRGLSQWGGFSPLAMRDQSARLYDMAARVSKALAKDREAGRP